MQQLLCHLQTCCCRLRQTVTALVHVTAGRRRGWIWPGSSHNKRPKRQRVSVGVHNAAVAAVQPAACSSLPAAAACEGEEDCDGVARTGGGDGPAATAATAAADVWSCLDVDVSASWKVTKPRVQRGHHPATTCHQGGTCGCPILGSSSSSKLCRDSSPAAAMKPAATSSVPYQFIAAQSTAASS